MSKLPESKNILFDDVFPSGSEQRREILHHLVRVVTDAGVRTAISSDELVLVLDEALTNAMEHGNGWDVSKKVSVLAWRDKKHLHVTIEDEGAGFDYSNPKSEFISGNKMSLRGRGLRLICRFCSPVWDNEGRRIQLTFKIA